MFVLQFSIFYSISSILFLLLFGSSIYAFNLKRIALFSKALNGIVKGYFVKNNLSIDFMIVNETCSEFAFEIIANVMKENAQLIGPVTVRTIEEPKVGEIHLSRSTIIVVEQDLTSVELLKKVNTRNIDVMRFQHYVVVQKVVGRRIRLGKINAIENYTIQYTNFKFLISR